MVRRAPQPRREIHRTDERHERHRHEYEERRDHRPPDDIHKSRQRRPLPHAPVQRRRNREPQENIRRRHRQARHERKPAQIEIAAPLDITDCRKCHPTSSPLISSHKLPPASRKTRYHTAVPPRPRESPLSADGSEIPAQIKLILQAPAGKHHTLNALHSTTSLNRCFSPLEIYLFPEPIAKTFIISQKTDVPFHRTQMHPIYPYIEQPFRQKSEHAFLISVPFLVINAFFQSK